MNICIILAVVVLQATCCIAFQWGSWSAWSACKSGWNDRTRTYKTSQGGWGSESESKSCSGGGGGNNGGGGGNNGGGGGNNGGGSGNNVGFTPREGQPKTSDEWACLNAHNQYRRAHGKPDLKWDANIAKSAGRWARNQVGFGRLVHTKNSRYGENLAYSSYPNAGGRAAVKDWYDEICMYNSCKSPSSETGHFTQVIWESSRYLGCGIARSGDDVYVVAQYYPPGNYYGRYCDEVGQANQVRDETRSRCR